MAEPTIAPSDTRAIASACSGLEIPKPTATGISVYLRIISTIDLISVLISLRMPVTPSEDTQYTKPSASLAIISIRFSDVGAIKDTTSTPCL